MTKTQKKKMELLNASLDLADLMLAGKLSLEDAMKQREELKKQMGL